MSAPGKREQLAAAEQELAAAEKRLAESRAQALSAQVSRVQGMLRGAVEVLTRAGWTPEAIHAEVDVMLAELEEL